MHSTVHYKGPFSGNHQTCIPESMKENSQLCNNGTPVDTFIDLSTTGVLWSKDGACLLRGTNCV